MARRPCEAPLTQRTRTIGDYLPRLGETDYELEFVPMSFAEISDCRGLTQLSRDQHPVMLYKVLAFAAVVDAFEAPMAKVAQSAMKVAAPAFVAGALVMGNAGTVLAADEAAGGAVFDGNCAACHAGGQNVIMPEKTLEKEERRRPARPSNHHPHHPPSLLAL